MKLLFRIIFKISLILTILAGCSSTEDELVIHGIALFEEGQYDRAITYFNKAIEINPSYAEAYNSRGIAYALKGQYDKAISDHTKAIEINPSYAEAYNSGFWDL